MLSSDLHTNAVALPNKCTHEQTNVKKSQRQEQDFKVTSTLISTEGIPLPPSTTPSSKMEGMEGQVLALFLLPMRREQMGRKVKIPSL